MKMVSKDKRNIFVAAAIFVVIVSVGIIATFANDLGRIFPFNKENALSEWKEKIFRNRVVYSVEIGEVDGYLGAQSKEAASGIFYRLRFNPRKKPFIRWKWKVVQFPAKREDFSETKGGWIERDDYAARFYVIFPGFTFFGTKTLEYVWDKDLAQETILTSPYFKNIKIIVAESGDTHLGEWVSEQRNIVEDYKKAFGRRPGKVGAIAIMTDSDNTLSTAEAYYDEIEVGYEKYK
jgi:hypothetical protein